jgi:hypothetical protein
MEVIQWTNLWEFFKEEYEKEENLLGGALGAKASEDLKLRIIEHVLHTLCLVYNYDYFALASCLSIESDLLLSSEYLGCVQVLCKGYPQEACRSSLPDFAGLYFSPLHVIVFYL